MHRTGGSVWGERPPNLSRISQLGRPRVSTSTIVALNIRRVGCVGRRYLVAFTRANNLNVHVHGDDVSKWSCMVHIATDVRSVSICGLV